MTLVSSDEAIDERALSKLRWRCRRGLLENDIFIERFFARHGQSLTAVQGQGLSVLMELGDNDLLDLLLQRKSLEEIAVAARPTVELDRADVREVLCMLIKPVER